MNLVRAILLTIDQAEGPVDLMDLEYEDDQGRVPTPLVGFHVRLMLEKKWLDWRWKPYVPREKEHFIERSVFWLTDKGADVAEIISDDDAWRFVCAQIQAKDASVTFDTVLKMTQSILNGKL